MERDCESELSKLNIEQNACIYHFGASVIHGQRSNILRLLQMGVFTDGNGIPLAFSLFPGNQNGYKSLKSLENKILQQFDCEKFVSCSGVELASKDNRVLNHMG